MADVTEHNTEKEREGHTCKQGWVHLLVLRYIEEVDDELESPCEVVSDDVRWWADVRAVVFRVQPEESWHLL